MATSLQNLFHACFVLALLVAWGCVPSDDEIGPEIVSLIIEPSTISWGDMDSDEPYFEAIIEVSGFDGPIAPESVAVFVQGLVSVVAIPASRTVEDEVTRLVGIPKSWLRGFAEGRYEIGAEVATAETGGTRQEIIQLDLAQVQVTSTPEATP
jgi:hypothetical protein